jgi:general L-amino acid transport system substrate-binding protein
MDFCKAVAAVLGDPAKVDFNLFGCRALRCAQGRQIDLLSRNSTWTMPRDLELVEFAAIAYYDGGLPDQAIDGR